MSNPQRGHVTLTADGAAYRLQLTLNALACLQGETGLSLKALVAKLQEQGDDVDFTLVAVIIWAAMQDHHPDMTLADVMRLNADGGLEAMTDVIQKLFVLAFPKASAAGAAGKKPPVAAKKIPTSPR
jgi:hypothetical protein